MTASDAVVRGFEQLVDLALDHDSCVARVYIATFRVFETHQKPFKTINMSVKINFRNLGKLVITVDHS